MTPSGDHRHREPGDVRAEETHLSMLYFSPDRVLKLLKPVDVGFVSFTDRTERLAATTREFELNHRISPDVHLGTSDIVENGEVRERLLIMRRLSEDGQLDRLLTDTRSTDLRERLREVARFVAAFHAGLDPVTGPIAEVAGRDRLRTNWEDSFSVLEKLPIEGPSPMVPIADLREVRALATAYLDGRGPLFEERAADGRIVDGHGDLRAEHVFCTDDGPRLIDCLAFRDDYRTVDVLNDVAFLAMDLHRLSGPATAATLIRDYDEFTAEHHPSTLAHHYVAYRAHVRAKVAAIRFGQGDSSARDEVAMYHRLALEHLRVGRVRLVLVGGGAGVGKSTVASKLSDRLGAVWLRSDEVRKGLAGVASDHHLFADPGEGAYRAEFSDRVHRELLDQARSLLERGESVVLDATWADGAHRVLFRELAEQTASTLTELRCTAPLAVAKERIARRMASVHEPSDATPAIADHIAARFDEWPEATDLDTAGSIAASADAACRAVLDSPPAVVRTNPCLPAPSRVLSYESVRFYLSRASILTGAPTDPGSPPT